MDLDSQLSESCSPHRGHVTHFFTLWTAAFIMDQVLCQAKPVAGWMQGEMVNKRIVGVLNQLSAAEKNTYRYWLEVEELIEYKCWTNYSSQTVPPHLGLEIHTVLLFDGSKTSHHPLIREDGECTGTMPPSVSSKSEKKGKIWKNAWVQLRTGSTVFLSAFAFHLKEPDSTLTWWVNKKSALLWYITRMYYSQQLLSPIKLTYNRLVFATGMAMGVLDLIIITITEVVKWVNPYNHQGSTPLPRLTDRGGKTCWGVSGPGIQGLSSYCWDRHLYV